MHKQRKVVMENVANLRKRRTEAPTSTLTVYGTPRNQKYRNGRHTLLTDEMQAEIVALLRRGNFLNHACDIMQVSYMTVLDWMRRGEEEIKQGLDDEKHARFNKAIKAAQGCFIDENIQVMREGFERWQASAWLLERKFPQQFGEVKRMEMTGAEGGPIATTTRVNLKLLSYDELETLERLMSKAAIVDTTAEVVTDGPKSAD